MTKILDNYANNRRYSIKRIKSNKKNHNYNQN